jgi:hypothetical protein
MSVTPTERFLAASFISALICSIEPTSTLVMLVTSVPHASSCRIV